MRRFQLADVVIRPLPGRGCCSTAAQAEEAVDVPPLLGKIRAVGKFGEGHREAAAAWPRLAAAQADQVPEILAGMQGADILACNWIRSAVETIVQRHLKNGGTLPVSELERLLADHTRRPVRGGWLTS